MASTKNEVRDRAAEELGVLRIGQSLQNQDDVRITKGYDEVYDILKEKGLAAWALSGGSVPDRVTPWMAGWVAVTCLNTYGVSDSRYTRLINQYGLNGWKAEREIRNLLTPEYASQEDPTDY